MKMTKVKQTKTNTIKPIKPFKSLDEEADFWDTHSVVDEINDGTVVGFHQANKTSTITIRFQAEFLQELRNKAFKKGVGPTTLARMWIMEKLQSSQA
jgi:predicted DNA binding CopG/RHH family protein